MAYNPRMTHIENKVGQRRVPNGWSAMTPNEQRLGGRQVPNGWHAMTPSEQARLAAEFLEKI